MLARVCQLKTLLLVLIVLTVSCTHKKKPVMVEDHELMTIYEPKWFNVNEQHSLRDSQGKAQHHLFYDTTPEFDRTHQVANIILTTPPGSPHSYQMDLSSGQRHYSHSYCSQKDVWGEVSGSFNRPTFGIGYLPRVLDQLGEPQKVIYFTKRPLKGSLDLNYFRARIIAAYVEQICQEGNCLGKNNWNSRLVLIGIDHDDPALLDVTDNVSFDRRFKWEEVRAHLQNLDGRSYLGDNTFPLIRIQNLFSFDEAYTYFSKNSIFMNDQEIKKIQQGCFALYDRLWTEVGVQRPEDRAAKSKDELSQKVNLVQELRKKGKPVGFARRLEQFVKKYAKETATCEKFVYHGNINADQERFWFYSYMGIFFRLHKDGNYFDCDRKIWKQNIVTSQGELAYDLKKGIERCSTKDLDQAMHFLPSYLKSLKSSHTYYRFIDYDTHPFGSHQKIYSWTTIRNTKYDCSQDPNITIKKELEVFPEDVTWKARDVIDLEDELKIIY